MRIEQIKMIKSCRNESEKNNAAFTLLEVLVAMLILSVGLMGTAGFLIKVIRTDKLSKEMSASVVLAQSQMERLFQEGYLEVVSDVGTSQIEAYNTIAGYPDFKRTTIVSSTGTPGALGLTVTVDYKAFGEHTYTAKTILSRDIQ